MKNLGLLKIETHHLRIIVKKTVYSVKDNEDSKCGYE